VTTVFFNYTNYSFDPAIYIQLVGYLFITDYLACHCIHLPWN